MGCLGLGLGTLATASWSVYVTILGPCLVAIDGVFGYLFNGFKSGASWLYLALPNCLLWVFDVASGVDT